MGKAVAKYQVVHTRCVELNRPECHAIHDVVLVAALFIVHVFYDFFAVIVPDCRRKGCLFVSFQEKKRKKYGGRGGNKEKVCIF